MSELLKGFYTVLMRDPPRIQVQWDRITQENFDRVEVAWWCIGDHGAENVSRWIDSSQYLIAVKPSKTYMIAAQAHFTASPITGVVGHYSTEWAWGVVKMPQEDKPQYTNLGQVTVIDTPRGPAILLDELWEACGQ